MFNGLQSFWDDPIIATAVILLIVLCVVFSAVLSLASLYAMYFLLTLPMRRNERGRLFLDLLELGLKDGRTPEAAISEAAATRDLSLGARFHLLSAYLAQSLRLHEALVQVPRLLPPQIVAMLKAGERLGDVSKVLPACRLLLRDSVSQVRGALNYLLLLAFVVTPFAISVPILLRVKVLPSFKAVFDGMLQASALPPFTQFVFEYNSVFTVIQLGFFVFIWLLVFTYLGGPRLRGWVNNMFPGGADHLLYLLPWRRKRLQRDFSAMLAVLLDSGVPEAEAVKLAGESTANAVMIRRSARAANLLQKGAKLSEAVQQLDDSPEFRWRLANALQRAGGFLEALSGWHEALDAKAFQLEQTAAQVSTTLLVLVNGLIVGCIMLGIFIVLISLINHMTLW
jgi:type II secretory pathway component PulF